MTLRRAWFSGPFSVAAIGLIMLLAPAVPAHDTCCDHTSHATLGAHTCLHNSGCDAPWTNGFCTDKQLPNFVYCSCKIPQPNNDYALLLVNDLTALGGPPAPNTTLSYQTSIGPNSFGELLRGDETVVSFAPNTAGPGGFLSLTFGSFADPNAVPVSVDQWFFEFPPGTIEGSPSGPSSTALAPATTPQLLYDSSTNVLSTPPDESMLLVLTNDVDTDAPLRLLWAGVMSPTGDVLQVLIESVPSSAPAPVPTFTNVGAYSLIVALLVIAGILLASNRIWRAKPIH